MIPTCAHPDRALLAITRYDVATGHWTPRKVCHVCAGPAYLDERESIMLPQQVRRGSGMVWPANGR